MHFSRESIGAAMLGTTITLMLTCAAVGCDGKKATPGPADAAPPSGPTAVASAVAPPPSTPEPLMDIPQRFAYEAAHRPKGGITPEQVFDAFAASGMEVTERKQHLARAYEAMYCQGAKAEKEKLYFSVCEYANEGDAEKGVAAGKLLGTTKRDSIRNGKTLFMILYPDQPEPVKAKKIFLDLKAPDAKP